MSKFLIKLLHYPRTVLIVLLVLTVVFFAKMITNSRMETDLDEYMPKDHPAFSYSDQAEEWFNIKDGIIIAVENKAGIYNQQTLGTVRDLTKKFQGMEGIEKKDVTSLYTADNIVGTEEGLDVKAFYTVPPEEQEELTALQNRVRSNDMAFGRLVSEDETVTLIIAAINDDVFSQEYYREILKTAEAYESESIQIHVAGRPIVEGTMALLGPADMKKMVPIVIAVIILVLYLSLRSARSTLLTMGVVLLSTVWAFGLMSFFSIPIYAVSTMIPVMLIAIGVADGIHLYSHLQHFTDRNPQATKLEAVTDMICEMWKPVVMTSVTTAVGFVSLLTSQVYPIKYFGLFTAFGVLGAMVFSLVLIPAGIMVFNLPRRKNKKESKSAFHIPSGIAAGIIKYRSATLFVTIAVIVFALIGIQKVWINSSFLDKFERDSEIVLTDAFINQHFGGTSTLNLVLDSKENDAFKSPEVLSLVYTMQNSVTDSLHAVGNTFSLTNYIARMNKVMHADDEAFNSIPDDQDLIAQYLLLYEMSGDPENLWKVVDYDFRKMNVNFQLKSDNSKTINTAIVALEEYRDDFDKLGITMNYAGSGYKGLVFTELILEGQIMSLILSLFIIIGLLGLMFKSIKIGLIGSVPIVITAVIGFGVMGWMNIPLNTTTALLSSIAVGIGIDFAVHFLEQYKLHSVSGDKLLTAQRTMDHSGIAILLNAVVVISGFLVLLFSVFPPNRELGSLVSLNMFVSFIGTLTIMLIMLNKSNVYFNKSKEQ
ncbi:MAG: MMPL family transporter [Ignavibacteriaceae bacterium]|nr:MMPL family transporter [Ignavibacteriaceae bacterium]